MKRNERMAACGLLVLLILMPLAAGTVAAWPWNRPQPTADITASPEAINAGESSTIKWESTNGAAYLDGASVPAAGTRVVKPQRTETHNLAVTNGRRVARDSVTITVATEPQPPEPPTPPVGDSNLSAVGIGSAFAISDTLSRAAASHDLRVFIESQSGTWVVIDPLQLGIPGHPVAFDAWVKLLKDSGKKEPAVIWYKRVSGKVTILGINECSATTTGSDLLNWAKACVPPPTDSIVVKHKRYSLGLNPGKRAAFRGRSVSEILKPLAPENYPKNVDLRGQFPRALDQSQYGSCVSQSLAACYEAAVFRVFGVANKTAFSPNFLATVGDGWNGAWGSDIANILMTTGIVTLEEQPNYSHKLPTDWKTKAAQNKALGVYGPPNGNSRGYVAAAIARGLPVSVAIAVGNGFSPDSEGYITYARGAGGQVNHQVIAAGGYFERDGKRWWIMKNSWGAGWGNLGDGCAFLEDRFLDDDTDMWVIVVPSANPSFKFDSPFASMSVYDIFWPVRNRQVIVLSDGAIMGSWYRLPIEYKVDNP